MNLFNSIIIEMVVRLSDISKLSRLTNFFTTRLESWKLRRRIDAMDRQYGNMEDHPTYSDKKIRKITFSDFTKKEVLLRWLPERDNGIGGNSSATFEFDEQEQAGVLTGQIDASYRQKLKRDPFIALLQSYPFFFYTKMFNALRMQLKTDGLPISLELFITSVYGQLCIKSQVISKEKQWGVYELPLRNFQIDGEQLTTAHELNNSSVYSIRSILDNENIRPGQARLFGMSIRLQSAESITRQLSIRKIESQLVSTVMGTPQGFRIYNKPYFYKVNPETESNSLLKEFDTGAFRTRPQSPKHSRTSMIT